MKLVKTIKNDLGKLADPVKKEIYQRFFKTGKGQYAEGDIFLGLTTTNTRSIAKKYFKEISLPEVKILMNSKIHEHRSVAFMMLVEKYQFITKTEPEKKEIVDFYLKNAKRANNWDLVDMSSYKIIGDYLTRHPEYIYILYKLVKSENLWEQRISIISTMALIKKDQLEDSLKISKILLDHNHDLIHKAVGWMLRELGKRDQALLEKFLKENYQKIPRTTLRYAIERFGEKKRKKYLLASF